MLLLIGSICRLCFVVLLFFGFADGLLVGFEYRFLEDLHRALHFLDLSFCMPDSRRRIKSRVEFSCIYALWPQSSTPRKRTQ